MLGIFSNPRIYIEYIIYIIFSSSSSRYCGKCGKVFQHKRITEFIIVDKPVDNLLNLSTEYSFTVDKFNMTKLYTFYSQGFPQYTVENFFCVIQL